MTEKNIAVIGAGYWGKNLVRNFHQLYVLKTICDGAQPIREEMSKAYPDTIITANVADALKDDDIRNESPANNRVMLKLKICPTCFRGSMT
jgi:predicted dehydrogenase